MSQVDPQAADVVVGGDGTTGARRLQRGGKGVPRPSGHRGNKAALPSKPCAVCARAMTWRRRWAKNWAEVKYCSEACRREPAARG